MRDCASDDQEHEGSDHTVIKMALGAARACSRRDRRVARCSAKRPFCCGARAARRRLMRARAFDASWSRKRSAWRIRGRSASAQRGSMRLSLFNRSASTARLTRSSCRTPIRVLPLSQVPTRRAKRCRRRIETPVLNGPSRSGTSSASNGNGCRSGSAFSIVRRFHAHAWTGPRTLQGSRRPPNAHRLSCPSPAAEGGVVRAGDVEIVAMLHALPADQEPP